MGDEGKSQEKRISRGVVAIYLDYMGRGPAHVTTVINEGTAMTVCRESMTKAERRLVERGESESVRATRRKFQDVMRDDYLRMVEGVLGHPVEAFLSDHDADHDVAVEVVSFPRAGG